MISGLSQHSLEFPDPDQALRDPNGLLALGGDLSPQRILAAYQLGIFPWYESGHPILWWSPDPRMVLFPDELHISRSLHKALKKSPFRITANRAFNDVIRGCAAERAYAHGTWITPAMQAAYIRLHEMGFAHSIESWNRNGKLAGGLYGVSLGKNFFGESMFSRESNASKIAFVHLVKLLQAWDYGQIDCQVSSEHLANFGARNISREEFRRLLPAPGSPALPSPEWSQLSDDDLTTSALT